MVDRFTLLDDNGEYIGGTLDNDGDFVHYDKYAELVEYVQAVEAENKRLLLQRARMLRKANMLRCENRTMRDLIMQANEQRRDAPEEKRK